LSNYFVIKINGSVKQLIDTVLTLFHNNTLTIYSHEPLQIRSCKTVWAILL